MIPEWFQMSLRYLATTIFDAGKLKPKYLFKKLFILKKSRIFNQNKYSFFLNREYSFKTNIHLFKIQNIHSKKLFIFENPKYSFKENIHFFKIGLIAQGYMRTEDKGERGFKLSTKKAAKNLNDFKHSLIVLETLLNTRGILQMIICTTLDYCNCQRHFWVFLKVRVPMEIWVTIFFETWLYVYSATLTQLHKNLPV